MRHDVYLNYNLGCLHLCRKAVAIANCAKELWLEDLDVELVHLAVRADLQLLCEVQLHGHMAHGKAGDAPVPYLGPVDASERFKFDLYVFLILDVGEAEKIATAAVGQLVQRH